MAVESDRAFHDLAVSVKPAEPGAVKPSRFWAAILYHGKKPEDVKAENDFLWIKCHGKITIQTILNEYAKRHAVELLFKYGDTNYQPPNGTPLSDLDQYNDKLIVLRAVDAASIRKRSSCSPAPISERPWQTPSHSEPLQPGLPSKDENVATDAGQVANIGKEDRNEFQVEALNEKLHQAGGLTGAPSKLAPSAAKNEYKCSPSPSPSPSPLREQSPAIDYEMDESQDASEKESQLSLQQLVTSPLPETLERGVEEAVQLLETLKSSLKKQVTDQKTVADAEHWCTSISNLQSQAVRTRTVVGVVGNTGAGKSSVINAMLDEERLVPTNCMRACTAVVTELSWNDDDNENKKYRAAIEFIKPEDWKKELEILFKDLIDVNGEVSRESSNPDTDAGVAYAKIKAVYPQMTKEEMAQSSVEKLMRFPVVTQVLGTTIDIQKPQPEDFYRKLQTYVDSKEKNTGKEKEKREKRKTEYWPLIKVVRIFVKSPALATGAVIVDLPGVQDSNVARAAVAAGYMKQCTGLWIVAPITRAVDDKSAKKLLGDVFKRQMKYDGMYSAVTFICSKTDDISITEATDSLDGLKDTMEEFFEQEGSIQRQIKELEKSLAALKNEKDVYDEMFNDQDELLDTWDDMSSKLDDGEKVFRPRDKKRKAKAGKQKPRKRRANSDEDLLDDSDSNENSGSDQESHSDDAEEQGEPLTSEAIEAEIDKIKGLKKQARKAKIKIDDKMKQVKKDISVAKDEQAKVQAKMSAMCISSRNEYSRGAIRHDFAMGVEEVDRENAEEEDAENFDPEDRRDYTKVAQDLPVFCVSSRAYQKLSGRLKKDSAVPGFTTLEETEVPALQAHCKKLTEAGRAATCRRFLNSLSQLLTSINLWASNDGSGVDLTNDEKMKEANFIKKRLAELEKALEKSVSMCVKDVKNVLKDNIFDKYEEAVGEANNASVGTAAGWGAHKNDGGLYWATYKATVRQSGTFSGASGPRDFNVELCEPVMKYLASGWERAFQRHFPRALESYKKDANAQLQHFHDAIGARARDRGIGLARLDLLDQQVKNHKDVFQTHVQDVMSKVTECQRDVNREFTPVITAAMEAVYTICSEESGKGSYARMKAAMLSHVDQERSQMFWNSVKGVEGRLTLMCRDVETHCANQTDVIWNTMQQDYMALIGGVSMEGATQMPKEERKLRRDVKAILDSSDSIFDKIVRGETDPEPDQASDHSKVELGGDTKIPEDITSEDVDMEQFEGTNDTTDYSEANQVLPSTEIDLVHQQGAAQMVPEPQQVDDSAADDSTEWGFSEWTAPNAEDDATLVDSPDLPPVELLTKSKAVPGIESLPPPLKKDLFDFEADKENREASIARRRMFTS